MASAVPMETVVEFIKRINAGNVDKLCELMTEDHVFQDALGKRFIGRETLRGGWKMYYEMVSDYKVRGEQFFVIKTLWRYLVRPAAPASATANLPAQEASGRYRRPGKLSCVMGGLPSGAFTRNLRARENLIEPR